MARAGIGKDERTRGPCGCVRIAGPRRPSRSRPAAGGGSPARSRSGSTPCIAGTSPRCTATPTTSSATTTRRRTPRSGRSSRPSPTSSGSRSAPGRPTATAPRRSASGSSRSRATRSPQRRAAGAATRRRRSRPRPLVADPLDVEARRDDARRGRGCLAGGRPPARRSTPGDGPALRRGDVDRRDRRRPRPVRGRGPGADPSRPADGRRATSAARRRCRAARLDRPPRRIDDPRPRRGVDRRPPDRPATSTRSSPARCSTATAGPAPDGAAGELDPAARRAADRLRHDLVRVHPSFRFEERLATRLAEAAVALRVPLAAGDGAGSSRSGAPPSTRTSSRRACPTRHGRARTLARRRRSRRPGRATDRAAARPGRC